MSDICCWKHQFLSSPAPPLVRSLISAHIHFTRVRCYFYVKLSSKIRNKNSLRSSIRSFFILHTTYPRSSVTPTLAGPSRRRPPGMWRSPSRPRQWWSPWLEGHTRGIALVVAPQKDRLSHPGDVHFDLLKPISFIPWFRNGQGCPKGLFLTKTKKRSSHPSETPG